MSDNDHLAQLDAEIIAEYVTLSDLENRTVECRVRLGNLLEERRALTPRGEWGPYLRGGTLPFKERKAYDNIDFAYLHREHQFDFARLADMSVEAVRQEAHTLRGSQHSEEVANQLRNQRAAATIQMAELVHSKLDWTDRRKLTELTGRGWLPDLFEQKMLSGIIRRGERLSEPQRELGLTHLIVDSGAYSAAQQGTTIPIDEYCDFALENPWVSEHGTFVNLDHIDRFHMEESAHISFENFKHMKSRGLNPMPVFHAGENYTYLEKYLDQGCDYIGLGGSAWGSQAETVACYNRAFEIIERHGRRVRVHAFGDTVRSRLLRFPFDSADSTSWLIQAGWRTNAEHHDEDLAFRTYLEARRYARLDREINERRPGFALHFVFGISNPWAFPALNLLRHRKALVSYFSLSQLLVSRLKQFIENPQSVLAQSNYARKLEMLEAVHDPIRRY
jgi:hypothetical protein